MSTYVEYPSHPHVVVDTTIYDPELSALIQLPIDTLHLPAIDVKRAQVGDYVHMTSSKRPGSLVFWVVERAWRDGGLYIWITTRPGRFQVR